MPPRNNAMSNVIAITFLCYLPKVRQYLNLVMMNSLGLFK